MNLDRLGAAALRLARHGWRLLKRAFLSIAESIDSITESIEHALGWRQRRAADMARLIEGVERLGATWRPTPETPARVKRMAALPIWEAVCAALGSPPTWAGHDTGEHRLSRRPDDTVVLAPAPRRRATVADLAPMLIEEAT